MVARRTRGATATPTGGGFADTTWRDDDGLALGPMRADGDFGRGVWSRRSRRIDADRALKKMSRRPAEREGDDRG